METTEAPTREDVLAEMNGTPDVSGAGESVEAPAQDASTPSATPQAQTDPKAEIQALKDELVRELQRELAPVRSQLGQFSKLRADLQRQEAQKQKQTAPASWEQLDPDTRKTTQEILRHAFLESEEGKRLLELEQRYSQREQLDQQREVVSSIADYAQQIAGADFKTLDPILGKLYEQAYEAASQGNPEAQQLLTELHGGSRYAIKELVNLAKAEQAKAFEAQTDKVKTERADRAKRVGATLGSQPAQVKGDWMSDMPKDPKEQLAWLKQQAMKESMDGTGRLGRG